MKYNISIWLKDNSAGNCAWFIKSALPWVIIFVKK